ncbi:thioesterase II family protein [Streptomyces sp. NPDC127119]|uniref:thioesterase II family protein n=1 Tax=Streptomyces sp. NPDC127119 TaxID=3345370 RepID=UPI0036266396
MLCVQYPGRRDRRAEDGRAFVFFGHGTGSVLAFEVARRYQDDTGTPPARLLASGCPPPSLLRGGTVHRRDDDGIIEELRAVGGTDPVYRRARSGGQRPRLRYRPGPLRRPGSRARRGLSRPPSYHGRADTPGRRQRPGVSALLVRGPSYGRTSPSFVLLRSVGLLDRVRSFQVSLRPATVRTANSVRMGTS